jgi:hypothetical protein
MCPAPAGHLLRVLYLDAQVEHQNVKLLTAGLLDVDVHPKQQDNANFWRQTHPYSEVKAVYVCAPDNITKNFFLSKCGRKIMSQPNNTCMKMAALWVFVLCSLVKVYQCFRNVCCLLQLGDNYSDNGGSKHLQNINNLLSDYMEQQPTRQPSSNSTLFIQILGFKNQNKQNTKDSILWEPCGLWVHYWTTALMVLGCMKRRKDSKDG